MTLPEFFYWLRLKWRVWRLPTRRLCPCGGVIMWHEGKNRNTMGGASCQRCAFSTGSAVFSWTEAQLLYYWKRQR